MKHDTDIVRQLDQAEDTFKRGRLRAMQRMAVGLLLLAAVLFAVARALRDQHPAWGYVAAFAEAAMIGAMADWFAVVALFRHPLGIPLWHTAIIPNSKETIGSNLGAFVENHLVTEDGVAAQLKGADLAGRAGQWLQVPENAAGAGKVLASVLARALERVDDERMRAVVREFAGAELAKLDLSRLAGGYLETLVGNGMPQQVLDNVLEKLITWLGDEGNHDTIGEFILRCFAIDNPMIRTMVLGYAPKAIDGLREQAVEIRMNRDHALRAKVGDWIADSARRLQSDPAWQAGVARYQQGALENADLQAALGGLWGGIRERLGAALQGGDPAVQAFIGSAVQDGGRVLAEPGAVRDWVNGAIEAGGTALVRRYRGEVGKFIERQLARWTREEMSDRIELAIGRDLQFIRINGTIVGGLVGLLIHALTQAF
ncbi:uncharacterized membrane-anchored protein YjiN (DUF445 family) [Pseudoduganella lurida]|uniref:Uncharacterized membrane-anchored protein YjiN (DUF445 family) n=1 Tax=Pseudoduganella lurida TaxID=1036180 RepID=A0A562RKZ4_9BURK|nr:DUF445 domain-containing protein [Pseudoduganella lurida]TWI69718.1 uncharacterized membrane-anchored protein YjiN (DUF445 family) [Pseudoduganella lurida]